MINTLEKRAVSETVIGYNSDISQNCDTSTSIKNSGGGIKISGLSFSYPNSDYYLFKSLNLNIEPGEAISLLGPSGCGKSSLLHLIAGFNRPSKGNISIDGETITGPSSKCNLMLQKATLYPWLSVYQNAAFGLRVEKLPKNKIKDVVMPLLKLVKLEQFANRNIRQLSGGQQQRVALARSLATSPSVMLLDEPFSALDTFTRIELQNEIRNICKRKSISLIVVTHDFDEAIRMSDRIFMMTNKVGGDIVSEISNHNTFTAKNPEEAIALQRSKITSLWHKHMKKDTQN